MPPFARKVRAKILCASNNRQLNMKEVETMLLLNPILYKIQEKINTKNQVTKFSVFKDFDV